MISFKQNFLLFIIISVLIFSPHQSVFADDSVCANVTALVGNQTLDLSEAFTQSRSAQFTMATNWAGSIECITSKQSLYYYQPFAVPVYLQFAGHSGITQWIKLTATNSPKKVSINGVTSPFNISSYPTTLTIKVELTSEPAAGSDIITSTTDSLTTTLSAVSSNSYTSDSTAREDALNQQWTMLLWAARQRVTFTFKPKATTCSTVDKTVTLNKASLNQLRYHSDEVSAPFTLDLTCSTGVFDTAINPVKVWLASNDTVDDADTILRNSSSTSSGIGIALSDGNQKTVVFADEDGAAGSTLLSIKQDDALSAYTLTIPLTAYYRIFDNKNASGGNITATATVMFSWD